MEEDKLQLQYLQVEEVKNAFIRQLIKDAEMCDIHIENVIISFDTLNDLIQNIERILIQISRATNGFEKIQSWLYRVDVSEITIKNKLKQYPDSDYLYVVSELIVKRTLQKVVLRFLHNQGKL
ncbi:MAG: hypothetical protein KatS3mg027_0281 [Bacteroidia bacterium]|nr:MAG: hypothetical protein KatS3mg027_0281 [Bacteroidia bacterium]